MLAHIVCSIWPINRTLSGSTTPSLSGPGSNGNERVLHIPQISKARTLPSDGLMSYAGHSLRRNLTFLFRCSQCILQPQPSELVKSYGRPSVSKLEYVCSTYYNKNRPEVTLFYSILVKNVDNDSLQNAVIVKFKILLWILFEVLEV